jgi:N-acetylneuraminate synthase
MQNIKIGERTIGDGKPLYFIADIGANHDGDLDRAYTLIELAKQAGADAAKFQNFQAAKIVSKKGFESLGGQLSHQSSWKKSVYETYQDASVPSEWTDKLKTKCQEVGIEYFTSPYDYEAVDLADAYVNVYKIGSGDITWLDIIEHIAKKGKPVILATGASTMEDVERAMDAIRKYTDQIVLMQCNTNYTADPENFRFINLNVLKSFREKYPDVILGLSDHTPGHATVLGAIALGARVFEKHFTDDNSREGPDHKFAMNPTSWKDMVDRSNELYFALGDGIKVVEGNEKESAKLQRRAIRAKYDLEVGHMLSLSDLEFLRPITEEGLPPYRANEIIGKKIERPVKQGEEIAINKIII